MLRSWATLIACLLVPLLGHHAGGQTFGDVSISVEPPPHSHSTGGYVEYRFTITNRSPNEDRRVTLRMPASHYGTGLHIRQLRRALLVPAGATARVSMLQPPLPIQGDGAEVSIDGQRARRLSTGIINHGHESFGYHVYSGGTVGSVTVLASRSITGELRDRLEQVMQAPASGGHYGQTPELARAWGSLSDWSHNWLAYSAYAGIVLRDEELAQLAEPARDAVWRYVAAGGTLLVVGAAEVPEPWQRTHARVRLDDQAVDRYRVGFGVCWSVTAETLLDWPTDTFPNELMQLWQTTGSVLARQQSVEQANKAFSVVDELNVPVRGLLSLMLVFAIAAGPVNLVVVSKLNRRIWLLWTVPVIAGVFAAAVFGYATFAEGWRADARIAGLTLLDETNHHATTLGRVAYYSPLTPSDGLRFGYDTELTPQVGRNMQGGEGAHRQIDWTHEQHLAAGWVSARVPAHFTVRKSETRRERLVVARDDAGRLTVTNALGADVQRLYLMDDAGQAYTAEQIAAGASATLAPVAGPSPGRAVRQLRDLYRQGWRRALARTTPPAEAMTYLQPNTYLALLEQTPFVEPGLATARQKPATSWVYGILAEAVDAD